MKVIKNIGKYFLYSLAFIFCLPFFLFALVWYFLGVILPAPIEILFYKKSFYFKDFNKKYSLGITHTEKYKLYNFIKKNNLNYNLIELGEDVIYLQSKNNENKIYIFSPANEFKLNKNNEWVVEYERQNFPYETKEIDTNEIPLLKEINILYSSIENFNEKQYKILTNILPFNLKSLEKAKQDPIFKIYKNKKELINILSN